MVEARKDDDKRPEAENAAAMSGLAEASAKLFAEQATAMAVMTAYGIRVASEMTSMMLGALRGPVAADGSEASDPAGSEPAKSEPAAEVVPLRPAREVDTAAASAPKTPVRPVREAAAKSAPSRTPRAGARSPKPSQSRPASRKAATAGAVKPASSGRDDLKKISGIGPRLEQVLNERGITRFSDLAGLGKAALKKLDGELGLEGRAVRDDWTGQARALSGGKG